MAIRMEERTGTREDKKRTLFAMVALMLAIKAIEPPLPNLIICLATAWLVMKTPVILISNIMFASLAVYSKAVVSC